MRPSGLNATAATGPSCAAERLLDQVAVAGVPDPHDVAREGGDQGPAVGAPGQLQNRLRVALEAEGGQAGVDGVEHQARVRPRPGEAAAVRAEGEGADAAWPDRRSRPES